MCGLWVARSGWSCGITLYALSPFEKFGLAGASLVLTVSCLTVSCEQDFFLHD